MKTKYLLSLLTSLLLFTSCEELGFNITTDQGAGRFSTSSILLDVRDNSNVVYNSPATRAGELDDFKILFFKGDSPAPEESFTYSQMPDVVVLPVGTYRVVASKGTDVEADWDSPYYLGESKSFQILKDSITSDIDPIVCRLQNVMVTVEFDPILISAMSEDSRVEVKVGDNAGLNFTKATEGRAGYFKYEGNSLAATFYGTVEGAETVETKSFDTVEQGVHYKIRFKLHSQDPDHSGQAGGDIFVEASVTPVNVDREVDPGEDTDLGDDERPMEGSDEGKDPETPVTPVPGDDQKAPEIVAEAPVTLDGVNVIDDNLTSCVLNITSFADGGFTKFECKIDSNTLDVTQVGLSNPLDLINPGSDEDALIGLGLLKEGQVVKGSKEMKFDLTSFLTMISALGPGLHNFELTVADANGETTKTLILESK